MKQNDKVDRPDDKTISIIINGRPTPVPRERDELSFDELVDLAFEDPARGPQIVFTITFRNAGGRIKEGELDEGQNLKLRDGTIVNVTRTDQS
ncbi:MAG: multiubiquitin domain-containing protein [Chloroflexi bacterium]|nr:multiubiquitin domain-containing protein [Chloroflexota bacterium]